MEREIDQVVQAIAVAFDQSQISLHQQALAYLSTIQDNANETWRLALRLFVDQNEDGSRKYPSQVRFFGLRVLDEFLDNRFERFDDESFQTLQQALIAYIQSEYVHGPAEADATFLRNKFSHTVTLFFLCTYTEQWPTFFSDLFTLIRPSEQSSETGFNRHVSLLFFHIVLEISGEVADQMIKSARSFSAARHGRDGRVRDGVRDRDAASINEAVLTIVAEGAERMNELRKNSSAAKARDLDHAIEVVDWGIRTFGSYVGWIDINLTVTPTTVPLLFTLLADPSLPIRLATSVALLRIVAKGLKEPSDKLQLLKVLSLGQVLEALESKTRAQQAERGNDTDEGEESYREALGTLLNGLGQELAKLVEECSNEEVRAEASTYLVQIQPVVLHFLSDEYDDTCSTVFPLLHLILTGYKRNRKISSDPLDEPKRAFLTSLLQVILTKLRWDEDQDLDPEDADEDDIAEFEKMRKDLRSFLDAILAIDQDLVTDAVRTLALNTISAFTNGVSIKWNDAELGIYLVYLFGEINKSGGKGRAAFCQAPPVDREKRKATDYAEFPLTAHGEMLFALVQSGIASFPNRTVALQFFETVSRYTDFFKIRKQCIIPALEAMVDTRGLHNDNPQYRSRVFYLFHRFIKELRNEIPADISTSIIDSIRDLLPIVAEIPELEEPEMDVLTEAIKNSTFDSQLYLFETAATLNSLLYKDPAQQSSVALSLVKPLMDDLSVNFQAFRANGPSDLIPIVKVHHIIMALGNIAKGFPDYPATVSENWIGPPMEVLTEMAQAILVCLEAMNVFKPIRDATRFAFARILATAGPTVTHSIPPLMSNLLAHFEPSELVDFMNFIGLLIHKLQKDMFEVLDELIGPLSAHITALLSQPITGTDDQRAHSETKKAYLTLLNNIMASKLQGIFISERNSSTFERLIETMQQLAEDVSDPTSQKVALTFLSRCVQIWGQHVGDSSVPMSNPDRGLPGFDRFIYERLVPTAFRVPSLPNFNPKDGQMMVVLHEIANLLQTICKTRGPEAYDFFLNVFLPSQNWPSDMALDFTTKMRNLDGKTFRKYFTDLIRSSRAPS
ncbi:ARM repeat-containing protein [Crassisporium funariophilum]|nr:ARM repeat-containing protein [Crassisporium funariophilum]